jgi:hypothetical protein
MHGYVPPRTVVEEAVTKAIDDYLLMERKARAWDALRQELSGEDESMSSRLIAMRMQQLLAQTVAPDTLKL